MATCITKARSNYFSVTDVPAFLTIMQKWEKDFGIRIMKKRIDEDQTVYAFSYETTSVNINDALCDLQKILPEWEAVIIQEIAYEQSLNGMMRYVIGKAIIITYNTVDTLDLSMLLKHMIASHHGKLEYGAITVPSIPEAMILHELDMIDSRIYQFEQVRKDLEPGSMSDKIFGLDTRVYRPL